MEKLGMTREGMLRSHRRLRDERVDYVYYGVLAEEWEKVEAKIRGGLFSTPRVR